MRSRSAVEETSMRGIVTGRDVPAGERRRRDVGRPAPRTATVTAPRSSSARSQLVEPGARHPRRRSGRGHDPRPRSCSTVSMVYVGPATVQLDRRRLEPVDAGRSPPAPCRTEPRPARRPARASATDHRRRRRARGRASSLVVALRARRPGVRHARDRTCRRRCRAVRARVTEHTDGSSRARA